jgi:hypothetical protein
VAELVTAEMPEVPEGARATRAVLGRVVRYLVRDAGSSTAWKSSTPVWCP